MGLEPSELIISYHIPNQTWTKIATDTFCLYGHYYLLMIHHYSKFIFVETLKSLQSSNVISKCKKIF